MTRLVCAVILMSLVPASALAQFNDQDEGMRYSWFGVGHSSIEIDVPGEDLDASGQDADASGWAFDVSFAVHEHLHLFGVYRGLELDDFADVEGHEKTFGIGTHFFIGEKISLFGRLGWIDVSLRDATVSADDDGHRATAGVRFMPWRGYEFRAGVDYVDLDDSGDDTGGFVGGDIWLTPSIALIGEYHHRDDSNMLTIGARLYFGE